MKESVFAAKVQDALKSVGAVCFNVHGHRFQKAGWPDIYVAHPRWTGWAEFKVAKGRASVLQEMVIRDLLRCGVPAFVVRWVDDAVYCELGKERLAWCEDWRLWKGQTRGIGLLEMFNEAGQVAVELVKDGLVK